MCQSCQTVRVNGILVHEYLCPDAWKDYPKECQWCGASFMPEARFQDYCCDECYADDLGVVLEPCQTVVTKQCRECGDDFTTSDPDYDTHCKGCCVGNTQWETGWGMGNRE